MFINYNGKIALIKIGNYIDYNISKAYNITSTVYFVLWVLILDFNLEKHSLRCFAMYLSAQTKASLERIIGITLSELSKMDFNEELEFIKKRTGKGVRFSQNIDRRMCSRGNPLMVEKRICTMGDIDKKIARLK